MILNTVQILWNRFERARLNQIFKMLNGKNQIKKLREFLLKNWFSNSLSTDSGDPKFESLKIEKHENQTVDCLVSEWSAKSLDLS